MRIGRLCIACFIAIVGIGAFSGCSYSVAIDPNLDPTANIANPVDIKAGLFVPEAVKSQVIEDNADWAHKYSFNIGEAAASIVTKSVSRVFKHVEILDAQPTQQMLADRGLRIALIPKFTSSAVSLTRDQGFFQDKADGSTQVSMQVIVYDDSMIQLTAVQASGMGVATKGLGGFTTGKNEYSSSVEAALRNMGDDMVHQLYGNYDIRKLGELTAPK